MAEDKAASFRLPPQQQRVVRPPFASAGRSNLTPTNAAKSAAPDHPSSHSPVPPLSLSSLPPSSLQAVSGFVDSASDAKAVSPSNAAAHPRHQVMAQHPPVMIGKQPRHYFPPQARHPMYKGARPPPPRPPMYVVGGVPRPRGMPVPPPRLIAPGPGGGEGYGAAVRPPRPLTRSPMARPHPRFLNNGVVPSPRGPPPRVFPSHGMAMPPRPAIVPISTTTPQAAEESYSRLDSTQLASKGDDIQIGPDNPMHHLFDEWYACWDAEVEAVYYYNNDTGEASWIHPQDRTDDESSLAIL